MKNDNLACGMYQLEHAAMCDNSSAAAVLAHIKRLKAGLATMGGELLAKCIDCGYLEGENTRLQHEQNTLFAGKELVARCYEDEQIKSQRLTADLAQLREMYADRDSDLAWEYGRANALEAENERLQGENEMYRHISVKLQAENERLLAANERMSGAWLKHERLQPDGELWASLDEVLAENEWLTAAQSHPAILRGPCSGNGGCDCPAGAFEDDGCSSAEANELAIVRRVYAECTHEHTLKPTGARPDPEAMVYHIGRRHEHTLREA